MPRVSDCVRIDVNELGMLQHVDEEGKINKEGPNVKLVIFELDDPNASVV